MRQLLGRFLARPDAPPTQVLVADARYGATYQDLDAAFRALRAGAELVATQVNRVAVRYDGEHLDTGADLRPPDRTVVVPVTDAPGRGRTAE